ncbi:hypothetical protein DRE_00917 [Drechslerella stenobrocha 248]|uniref:Uncharacterized protein n=1 Tax=Drechslerella stenobrocha 248 TaxID=1043628 RepID=W7HY43_9PEZI|nr:hypothetical protein DRE_00917 [Drechslerella stenobrocha 248]
MDDVSFAAWRIFPATKPPPPPFPLQPRADFNRRSCPRPRPPSFLAITIATAGSIIGVIEDYEHILLELRRSIGPHMPPSEEDIATLKLHLSCLLQSLQVILRPSNLHPDNPFNGLLCQLNRSLAALDRIRPPWRKHDPASFSHTIIYANLIDTTNMKLRQYKDMAHGHIFPQPIVSPPDRDAATDIMFRMASSDHASENNSDQPAPQLLQPESARSSGPASSAASTAITAITAISTYASILARFITIGTANTTPERSSSRSDCPTALPIVQRPPTPASPIPISPTPTDRALKSATDMYRRERQQPPQRGPTRQRGRIRRPPINRPPGHPPGPTCQPPEPLPPTASWIKQEEKVAAMAEDAKAMAFPFCKRGLPPRPVQPAEPQPAQSQHAETHPA